MTSPLIDAMANAAKAELIRQAVSPRSIVPWVAHAGRWQVEVQGVIDFYSLMWVALQAMWQPMETAPKDGRKIILGKVGDFDIYPCRWNDAVGTWVEDGFGDPLTGVTPTHWMPVLVPLPPIGERT